MFPDTWALRSHMAGILATILLEGNGISGVILRLPVPTYVSDGRFNECAWKAPGGVRIIMIRLGGSYGEFRFRAARRTPQSE